jgi:hypothetical protein
LADAKRSPSGINERLLFAIEPSRSGEIFREVPHLRRAETDAGGLVEEFWPKDGLAGSSARSKFFLHSWIFGRKIAKEASFEETSNDLAEALQCMQCVAET